MGREDGQKKTLSALDVGRVRALPWPAALGNANQRLSLEESYRAGQLIRVEVYDQGTGGRGRRGAWSLRLLKERVFPGASFATLARCVQIYDCCVNLGLEPPLAGVKAGHLLNMTHLSPAAQRRLLVRLGQERISVRELRETAGRRAERLRTPVLVKTLTALSGNELEGELEVLGQMDRAQAHELRGHLARAREVIQRLEAALVG